MGSHRRLTEGIDASQKPQKTPKLDDFRVIWRPPIFGFETPDFSVFPVILRCFPTAQKHFAGLKEVLQSSVISASARFTEVCRGLGRYAPDTPPRSRDFRKVLVLLQSYKLPKNSPIVIVFNSGSRPLPSGLKRSKEARQNGHFQSSCLRPGSSNFGL